MRNLGLDIIRSVAIIMVIISHSRIFFARYGDVQDLSFNGLFGVELFFVLSGFLIGGIIIRTLVEGEGSLIQFYSRRWIRTLPAYFLILSIVEIVAIVSHKPHYFANYLFVQNFDYEKQGFFGVSWSLSIEEWFYLLVPAALILLLKLFKGERKTIFFAFCIAVIVISVVAKIVYVYQYNPPWDAGVRKQIPLRLDSLVFGVLLVGIKHYYRGLYEKVSSKWLCLVSLCLIFGIGLYYVFELQAGRPRIDVSIIGRTILFDAISFSFALLIWALEKSKTINKIQGNTRKIFTFIAITSYSVYLIHLEIILKANEIAKNVRSIPLMIGVLVGTLFGVYILAYLLYRFWEKPFMSLRERKKSNQIQHGA